jgi:hypothetical protein
VNYNGYIWDLSKLQIACDTTLAFPCSCVSQEHENEQCALAAGSIVTLGNDILNSSFTDMFLQPYVGEIGSTIGHPGVSCKDIYRKRGDLGQGVFYITIRNTVFPVLCDSSIFPGQVATMQYKMSGDVEGDVYKLLARAYLNPEDPQLLSTRKSFVHYLTYLNEFWDRFVRASVQLYTNEKCVAFIDFKSTNLFPPYGFFTSNNVAAPVGRI